MDAKVLVIDDKARYAAHVKNCVQCGRAKFQWKMCPVGVALQAIYRAPEAQQPTTGAWGLG